MSERKVLNKYYPPDFDPSKIPRLRRAKNRQYTVRLMAPCNMRCTVCGEYIYKGKKFNARKETVEGEEYLGIMIFRFYIRCPRCLAEITFKTDPENTDYVVENGATRNFEALKKAEELAEADAAREEEEIKSNPMKLLEARTQQSKNEMDLIEALEDLKDLNKRQATVDYDKIIKSRMDLAVVAAEERLRKEEEDDEAFVRSVFGAKEDGKIIKRLADSDSDEEKTDEVAKKVPKLLPANPTDILADDVVIKREPGLSSWVSTTSKAKSTSKLKNPFLSGLVKVKSKPEAESKDNSRVGSLKMEPKTEEASSSGAAGTSCTNDTSEDSSKAQEPSCASNAASGLKLLMGYSDDSDSSDSS